MWIVRLFGLAIAALSYWLVNSQWTGFYADGTFSLRYLLGIAAGLYNLYLMDPSKLGL